MVATVTTFALTGLEATPVQVEVMVAPGTVGLTVVGLPSKAIRESTERVRAAFHSLGLSFPAKRITVNLSPAEALEVSMIHSVAGTLGGGSGLVRTRPFCDPHYSASRVALTGGGMKAKPGEMSLARGGIIAFYELHARLRT